MIHQAERKAPRERRSYAWAIVVIKIVVTTSLIAWLIDSGTLDMGRLRVLVSSPLVMVATAATCLCTTVLGSTIRWRVLLRSVGTEVPFLRAVGLQTTALFFNGLVPGNVGGDFLKNYITLGNQGVRLFVLVVTERLVGLVSLVWMAAVGMILSVDRIRQSPAMLSLSFVLVVILVLSILGPWLVLRWVPRLSQWADRTASGTTFVSRLGGRLRRMLVTVGATLSMLRNSRSYVIQAGLISLLMHAGNVTFFWFLTRYLENPTASIGAIFMIFPIGMLSLAVPISVSGLGVGHMFFEELFRLVDLKGGATIFNVYVVAQLVPALLGAMPYLLTRSSSKPALSAQPDSDVEKRTT